MNTYADQLAKAGIGVQGLQYPTPIRTPLPKLYCLPIMPPTVLPIMPPTVLPDALAFPPRPLPAPLPLARPLCPLPQAPHLPTPFSLPCQLQRSRLTPSMPFTPPPSIPRGASLPPTRPSSPPIRTCGPAGSWQHAARRPHMTKVIFPLPSPPQRPVKARPPPLSPHTCGPAGSWRHAAQSARAWPHRSCATARPPA